jgi:hypothetical protein
MIEDLLKQLVEVEKYRLTAECTAKYQQIVMRLPPGLLLQGDSLTKEEWGQGSTTVATLHAYVDLCAEELRLWRAGQIPAEIWQSWEEGICAGFRHPAVAALWENFFREGPYDELREFLKSKRLP